MKTIFYTTAYNAERTIRRAIDSVLNQTCGDWVYYCVDNGSADRTGAIIREYAASDARIIAMANKKNNVWEPGIGWGAIILNYSDDDFLCILDADDEYKSNFLSDMLRFADENNLDFAACRSDFIDDAMGVSHNEFVLNHDIIIQGEKFGTLFPEYFRFFGAWWGKLIKRSLLKKISYAALLEYRRQWKIINRSDTVSMLWYLRQSKRAGVLSKLLHNYRQYPHSQSRMSANSILKENFAMPEIYRDFLRAKVGSVSQENEQYIQEVFERSMRRTLANILLQENTVNGDYVK